MIWLGDRTRQPDHAHVEFARGVKNPIGLEVRTVAEAGRPDQLLDILNPTNEPGRMTLICRFGSDKIAEHLPALIPRRGARAAKVVWSTDPIRQHDHGRQLQDAAVRPIMGEIRSFFAIHRARRHLCRRHPSGNDRQERHGMHGRRRAISETNLSESYDTSRSAPQPPNSRSKSLSWWRNC